MTEEEGGEGDRARDGLQRARRHVDDQTLDLSASNALQSVGDRVDVPTRNIDLTRRKGIEGL
jgi:hypothetical protein